MKRVVSALLALCLSSCLLPVHASWALPFISEFHYDNAGGDVDEFVAVSGPSGLDLAGWQIALYNGGDGLAYRSLPLNGILGGASGGLGESAWHAAGIQNGPDAIALVSPTDAVVDFIAYEAGVLALGGAAAGMSARLLPVAEDAGTPVGYSLQRSGGPGDWDWVAAAATPGMLNRGLRAADSNTVPVPVPAAGGLVLWLAGLIAWWTARPAIGASRFSRITA